LPQRKNKRKPRSDRYLKRNRPRKPPHLIANQSTPQLHPRTAIQRPTTAPKHYL